VIGSVVDERRKAMAVERKKLSFDFIIDIDEENDSVVVLSDALGGDFEEVAKKIHGVDLNCVEIRIDDKVLGKDIPL
jgi:hypothetical protein